MNTPSPAALKKLLDQKKAFESYETSDSSLSASSPKGKGSQDRTSHSENSKSPRPKSKARSMTTSSRSTPSTPKTGASTERPKGSVSTSTTKKKSSSTTATGNTKNGKPDDKKPFVRREHLTQRPLAENEGLRALKQSLMPSLKTNRGGNSRAPHTVPRTSTTRNSKKENN